PLGDSGYCVGYGGQIALSADGSTALISDSHYFPGATSNLAVVYVYTRVDNVWSSAPVATFRNPDPIGQDGYCFGCGIGLSADGTTLVLSESGATVNGLPEVGKAF